MPETVLSVVCPIYNCEKYIETLVQSLMIAANSDRIEFLFVDDCSTDQSRRLCEQALEEHAQNIRFRYKILAHERNRGVSAARNSGVEASCGHYIGFLDGDDALLPGYAERILAVLDNHSTVGEIEILEFSFKEFFDDRDLGVVSGFDSSPETRVYSGRQRYKTLFQHGFFSWNRIYRRDLAEAVRFVEDGRAYEDIAFSMDILAQAGSVTRIDAVLIGYRKCEGSLTSIRNKRFLDQFTQLAEAMKRNRRKFGDGIGLEFRYLFKLLIILLKGMKIHPANDRLDFYRAASAYRHSGDSLWSRISTGASKSFSFILLHTVRTLRLS